MGERDAFEAREAAKRELTDHPERPWPNEDAIRTYLAGFAYRASAHRAEPPAEPGPERETDRGE